VEAVEQQKEQTLVRFAIHKKFDSEQLWKLVNSNRRYLSLHAGKQVTFKIKFPKQPEKEYLQFVIKLLENVADVEAPILQ
jgi:transcription-repair coupling factor (superfamily II helicase)